MDSAIVVLLLLALLMLAWVIGTAMRIESKLDPIVSSPVVQAVSRAGT